MDHNSQKKMMIHSTQTEGSECSEDDAGDFAPSADAKKRERDESDEERPKRSYRSMERAVSDARGRGSGATSLAAEDAKEPEQVTADTGNGAHLPTRDSFGLGR
jgi:hypothetical protein